MKGYRPAAKIFFLILFLVGVGAGIFLYYVFGDQNAERLDLNGGLTEDDNRLAGQPNDQNNQEVDEAPSAEENNALKTYQNDEYGFEFKYPAYLSVGQKAPNSVLGTYDEPLGGTFVGSDVWVAAKTSDGDRYANIKSYFNNLYRNAYATEAEMQKYFDAIAEGPAAACRKDNYENPGAQVSGVTCIGEGGGGVYVFIEGNGKAVFIDGYSGGYAGQSQEEPQAGYQNEEDFAKVLASFRFRE